MTEETIQLAQLLCSRLCHDLVGPAGAVNAGLELADEGGLDDAAMELMAGSAGELTNRLAFFRVAFGAAGGRASTEGGLSLNEAEVLAGDLLAPGRVELDWTVGDHAPDSLPAGAGKVLLLLVLIASESLPRGGTVAVHAASLPEGLGLAVTAAGEGARLRPDLGPVLTAAPGSELTARNVHGYLAGLLAGALGGQLEVSDEAANELRLMAVFPV